MAGAKAEPSETSNNVSVTTANVEGSSGFTRNKRSPTSLVPNDEAKIPTRIPKIPNTSARRKDHREIVGARGAEGYS